MIYYCHEEITTFNRGLSDERQEYTGQIRAFKTREAAEDSAKSIFTSIFTMTAEELAEA